MFDYTLGPSAVFIPRGRAEALAPPLLPNPRDRESDGRFRSLLHYSPSAPPPSSSPTRVARGDDFLRVWQFSG